MSSEPPLRAAVIGARRRRQGTGEFVARELQRLGCPVVAIVGTSEESLAEARAGLSDRHGITCAGYTSLARLLDEQPVDIVAVCSPAEAHLAQVELAAAASCHVFCEKPLWWSDDLLANDPAASGEIAARLADTCAVKGRHLALNTQWPFTLDAFRQLHPDAYGVDRPLERFSMTLSPTTTGRAALVDSGSHLLSMLHALVGKGTLEDVSVVADDAQGTRQTVRLIYRHAAGALAAKLRLAQTPEPPRPAGYSLNGSSVNRRVELPAYRLSFVAGDREVPLKDPLVASVEDFVRKVRAGLPPDREAIAAGMTQLHQLVASGSYA